MEKVNLGYSIKNMSIPTRKSYLLQVMEKNENDDKKNEAKSKEQQKGMVWTQIVKLTKTSERTHSFRKQIYFIS